VSATVRPDEAVARLLEAWRGEVEARSVYTILAERMRDSRRAQVISEIADGEGRHRERIEKRLRELGQPIPDPSTVRISPWRRAVPSSSTKRNYLLLLTPRADGSASMKRRNAGIDPVQSPPTVGV
jgi:rubrerythrin